MQTLGYRETVIKVSKIRNLIISLPNKPEQGCSYPKFGRKQITELSSLHRLATLGSKHANQYIDDNTYTTIQYNTKQ